VCTTNPHEWREATTALDLPALGIDWDTQFPVTDLLDGTSYQWGQYNYVRLDPHHQPAHIFAVG
jgi:starch synthase (maltosyl-transferring)